MLQRLTDDLNNPDPMTRLATLEDVLRSDDLTSREVAIKLALGSADTQMRDYAALLLLSRMKLVNLELSVPPQLQAQVDEVKGDKSKLAPAIQEFRDTWAARTSHGGLIPFLIHDFDLSTGTFKSACEANTPKDFDAQITGSTIQLRGECAIQYSNGLFAHMCSAILRLEPQGVFSGTFACEYMQAPLLASFRVR